MIYKQVHPFTFLVYLEWNGACAFNIYPIYFSSNILYNSSDTKF